MNRNRVIGAVMGGAMAVSVLGGAAGAFAQTTTPAPSTDSTQSVPAVPQRGFMREMGGDGEALAAALGITVEELDAARLEAHNAMIDQAVVDGEITQEQADALKAGTLGFGRGGFRGFGGDDTYLADALGITVEELQAAKLEAHATQLAAAVEAGYLTQEQADLMLARQAANAYVDRDAMQAQMMTAYEAALAAAVADGAITQAQADALLAERASQPFSFGGRGHGGGGHPGGGHGRGGARGFGGFNGVAPVAPTNTSTGQGA